MAQIITKRKLGLHLVNARRQEFYLYFKPLKTMVKWIDTYARVKYRNKPGKSAIGYHPGEVWGVLRQPGYDRVVIELFMGAVRGGIKVNSGTEELDNVVGGRVFILPADDFWTLYEALALMARQQEDFQEMLDDAVTCVEP